MRFSRWSFLSAAVLALALTAAGCGDDDGPAETPTVTASTSATTTASSPSSTASVASSAAVTPSATGTSLARTLARDPRYFLVVGGKGGDTLATISNAVDGFPGAVGGQNSVVDLQTINKITGDRIEEGQEIAVRLRLSTDRSIMPDTSIEETIGVRGAGGALVFLQPNLALLDGYAGKLVLHRISFADGQPADEGYGYVAEYWQADRRVFKANTVDSEATVADPTFIVAAGSLASSLTSTQAGDLYTFMRDGIPYAVKALQAAGITPQRIAEMLAGGSGQR